MSKVAVLIPCYNEVRTISKVVRDFHKALPEADIYVYDNNSTDHTGSFARLAGATVRKAPKQGKGNVVQQMLQEVNADCYLLVDGDDTYPAESAKKMVDLVLKDHADMVIGDRLSSTYFKENKSISRAAGNRLVRNLINKYFHGNITDVMTGYRALSKGYAKSVYLESEGFEIETEMTIKAFKYNMKIESVPVQYRDRPKGSTSKLNTFSDGTKVLKTIFEARKDEKNAADRYSKKKK